MSRRDNGYVADGTRCSKDNDDVCIGGKCVQVGCDGKLYDSAVYDICGLCGEPVVHVNQLVSDIILAIKMDRRLWR